MEGGVGGKEKEGGWETFLISNLCVSKEEVSHLVRPEGIIVDLAEVQIIHSDACSEVAELISLPNTSRP